MKKIKTNIVATIGSATENEGVLLKMVKNGFNIARINMSHVTQEEHSKQIKLVRDVAKKTGKDLKILVDLAGPKIRIGKVIEGTAIKAGKKIKITTKEILGDENIISTNYKKMPKEVSAGQEILVSDGKLLLKVLSTNKEDEIVCKILIGGLLSSKRGINLPGAPLTIPVITAKDKKDMLFAIKEKADYVALSFVREARDIKNCRNFLKRNGMKDPKIIAKIETMQAISNMESIISEADGVMVARGDLAMEIGIENVPIAQKSILNIAKSKNKFSILATQVLDSMEKSPTPTRAEVSDIANAIWDGSNAIMLSGETSIGKYPIESVSTIFKVAVAVETNL